MSLMTFHVSFDAPGDVKLTDVPRKSLTAEVVALNGGSRVVFGTAGTQGSKTPESFETPKTDAAGLRKEIESKVQAFFETPPGVVRVEKMDDRG